MYSQLLNEKEESIIEYINKNLAMRYTHIMETRELSINISKHCNESVEKASLAALLHDISKHYNSDEMRKIIYDYDKTIYPKHYTQALLHAKASVVIANRDFSVDDVDVLNAIERHTVGCSNMTRLDKILYLSDYLEPSRKLTEADNLRDMVFDNFDYVFESVVIMSIKYILDTKRFLDYNSLSLYNSIILNNTREIK